MQRQQLLADRQQFQREQLKAAELRALQSPTLGPTTPLQFPPSRPPHRSPTLMTPAQPTATLAIIQADAEGPKDKGEVVRSEPSSSDAAEAVAAVEKKSEEQVPITMATNVTDSVDVLAESVAMDTPSVADEVIEGVRGEEKADEGGDHVQEEVKPVDTEMVPTEEAAEAIAPEVQDPPNTSIPTSEESSSSQPTVNGTTPTMEDNETTPIVTDRCEATPISGDAPPTDESGAIIEATSTADDAPPPSAEILESADVVDETVTGVVECSKPEEEKQIEAEDDEGAKVEGEVMDTGEGVKGETEVVQQEVSTKVSDLTPEGAEEVLNLKGGVGEEEGGEGEVKGGREPEDQPQGAEVSATEDKQDLEEESEFLIQPCQYCGRLPVSLSGYSGTP